MMNAKMLCIAVGFLIIGQQLQAQDAGLYWKYKDYDGVAFTLPRAAIDIASWFIDSRDDRVWLRRINKARILVFEDTPNPVTARDMRRFDRKARHRHLEELLVVRDGKTHVRVLAKERHHALRKVVLLTQSPEAFVLLTLKGKIRWDDVTRAINKYNKEAKKEEKPLIPATIRT